MPWGSVLTCVFMLLQASLWSSISASKPKPVDIEFVCTENHPKDDVPIILLHGLTGNKETWHDISELIALETKKKVCSADLRNHGESPWDDDEFDVVAMTEDLILMLDKINARKAIVLGHSLGGMIAIRLALDYPEGIESVIIEDMRPNGVLPQALAGVQFYVGLLKEMESGILQEGSETEVKLKFLQLMKDRAAKINVNFEVKDLNYVPIKCSDGKCQLSINPAVLDSVLRDITELLNENSGRFDGPALFIYGAESPFKVGEDEIDIKKLFPKAELVAVEGADHFVHTFKKFSTEVIKFINTRRGCQL